MATSTPSTSYIPADFFHTESPSLCLKDLASGPLSLHGMVENGAAREGEGERERSVVEGRTCRHVSGALSPQSFFILPTMDGFRPFTIGPPFTEHYIARTSTFTRGTTSGLR